jgi:hypothetical protein
VFKATSKPDCGAGSISGATEERLSPTQIATSIFIFSVWDEYPMADCGKKLVVLVIPNFP